MADSYVCSGAIMRCTMGTSTANLTVLPIRTVNLTGPPMADISDHKSMVNLAPFGLCRSLGFPATAAATAAAHGHLTPMPCVHNTPVPWMGGKMDYLIKGQPALLKSSKCQCMWGGTISLVTDGQVGEGAQYVQKQPEVNHPHPQAKFIEPKTVSHVWQPVIIDNQTNKDKPYNQTKKSLVTANDNFNQQVPDISTQKPVDTIILWDAYWQKQLKKDGKPQSVFTKLRFIPQQIIENLFIVFYFEHEYDNAYDKDNAEFVLRFEIPGTLYMPKKYKIKGDTIRKVFTNDTQDGRIYYTGKIENFSSDLTTVDFSRIGFTEEP